MKLTDFRLLKKQVQRIGASPQEYEHRRLLSLGRIQLDVRGIIFGKEGIYWLTPGGAVTKVMVHAFEWDLSSGAIPKQLQKLALDGDFNSPVLRQSLPHFHLFTCDVLQRQLRRQAISRVCATRRTDGAFYFRVVNGDEVIVARDDFELDMCPHCFRMWTDMGLGTDDNAPAIFSLENYFANSWKKRWVVGVYRPDDFAPPGIYPADWRKIEAAYAAQVGYQCEQPSCLRPNFSHPDYQRFLHCSYRPLGPDAGDHWVLQAVCLRCFPDLPGREKLRDHADYNMLLELS